MGNVRGEDKVREEAEGEFRRNVFFGFNSFSSRVSVYHEINLQQCTVCLPTTQGYYCKSKYLLYILLYSTVFLK